MHLHHPFSFVLIGYFCSPPSAKHTGTDVLELISVRSGGDISKGETLICCDPYGSPAAATGNDTPPAGVAASLTDMRKTRTALRATEGQQNQNL